MKFSVRQIKIIDDYRIIIAFKDNSVKIFDMKPYLENEVFRELKDYEKFKLAHISFDTIQWPNGVDIDPEVLYEDSVFCSYTLLKDLFKNSKSKEDQEFYIKLSNNVLQRETLKVIFSKYGNMLSDDCDNKKWLL